MGYYSIKNTQNNSFIRFDSSNRITFTTNPDTAYYNTRQKTESLINNQIKPDKRKDFIVVPYAGKAKVISTGSNGVSTDLSNTTTNPVSHKNYNRISESQKIVVSLKAPKSNRISMSVVHNVSTPCLKNNNLSISSICDSSSIKSCISEYEEKERQVNKEICDLYHYIEFYDLSAAEGYKAYKALQVRLKKRREIKNALARFDIMAQSSLDDFINGTLERRLCGMSKRKYKCRAIPELFTGEDISVEEDELVENIEDL